jgi:hypothetical protein
MVYLVLVVIAAGLMALPRTLPRWAECAILLGGLVAALLVAWNHVVVTFG